MPPKIFGGKAGAEENKDPKEEKKDSKGEPSIPTNKWTKAVKKVKTSRRVSIRKQSVVEDDPFLQRFITTERAEIDDHLHDFTEIFTTGFWLKLVINPANPPYFWWSSIVTCCILYNLIFVIMRGCFWDKLQVPEMVFYWFIPDYLCDLIFIFDMYIKSRVGFLEQGLLCRDVRKLSKVYLKSWMFVVDVLSIFPLDFFYLVIGFNAFLRMNRCLKIWRMREFFNLAETHTKYPNLLRVANLILIIVIIIHWNCCLYFAISRAMGFGSDSWVYPDINDEFYSSFWKQYLFCFYWSTLTLTTIGDTAYPEQTISFLYCITCSLVGVLIFATIFGNVGALINEMDAARNEFQHKVDAVKRYMEIRQVTGPIQERVVKWFDYTWNNKESVDDSKNLEYLPEKLRAEICIHVHLRTLRKVEIFKDCEPGVLVELVLKLKMQVFSPGDYICRKGDIGKEMYIIKRGKLQVCSEDGKTVFVTLEDGAVFGEISVLNIPGNKTGNRRTASVRSVGYSDLFCLSKSDLLEALQEYPDARKSLSEKGKKMLRKDKLLDEEAARREERRQQNLDKKIELIADAVDDLQKVVNKLIDKISPDEAADNSEAPDEEQQQENKTPETPKRGKTPEQGKPAEKVERKTSAKEGRVSPKKQPSKDGNNEKNKEMEEKQ
ncbi:cyclic nucleotide-gated cation channel alpha-3-like [Saccostrea echinata]|uniref:cyclic nucleotide-gated cation channel alpha-3-like n=1 Tax=Saccostrea echinata TaxID=191078 RepID=UPI002A7EC3DC|nr:cyclic nucleotide-gated cation channel alpha-3-like [Saccostrea echinata]